MCFMMDCIKNKIMRPPVCRDLKNKYIYIYVYDIVLNNIISNIYT